MYYKKKLLTHPKKGDVLGINIAGVNFSEMHSYVVIIRSGEFLTKNKYPREALSNENIWSIAGRGEEGSDETYKRIIGYFKDLFSLDLEKINFKEVLLPERHFYELKFYEFYKFV